MSAVIAAPWPAGTLRAMADDAITYRRDQEDQRIAGGYAEALARLEANHAVVTGGTGEDLT